MEENLKPLTVIRDTKEGTPWTFSYSSLITELKDKKLDTGDYTVVGFEDVLRIERKSSTAEIAINISESRFHDWLQRLSTFRHKFIICEFSLFDVMNFPYGSGIPKYKYPQIRIKPEYILSSLSMIQVKYGIHVLFAGNRKHAELLAEALIKKVVYGV